MVVVIPQFVDMFAQNGVELPLLTRALLAVSDFFINRWYILAGAAAGATAGFRAWKATPAGAYMYGLIILKLPIVGKLMKQVYAARYARTISSMQAVGVDLPKAVSVTAKVILNKAIEKDLLASIDALNKGEPLSRQLEKINHFPVMINYITKLGEASGAMEELLGQIADFYDEESDTAISALTAMMEPLMIIVMAGIVVPVIMAIMTPMYQMYEQLM